jgi:hypothetical protein
MFWVVYGKIISTRETLLKLYVTIVRFYFAQKQENPENKIKTLN